VSKNIACTFFREKRGTSRKEAEQARAKAREEQLEATYSTLVTQGNTPAAYERLPKPPTPRIAPFKRFSGAKKESVMQQTKRGNGKRLPKHRRHRQPEGLRPEAIKLAVSEPPVIARLTLHDTDPMIGGYDQLFTLFYRFYRG